MHMSHMSMHRDLKLENVLFQQASLASNVKVRGPHSLHASACIKPAELPICDPCCGFSCQVLCIEHAMAAELTLAPHNSLPL